MTVRKSLPLLDAVIFQPYLRRCLMFTVVRSSSDTVLTEGWILYSVQESRIRNTHSKHDIKYSEWRQVQR